jgi:hypothetical protein
MGFHREHLTLLQGPLGHSVLVSEVLWWKDPGELRGCSGSVQGLAEPIAQAS